MFPGPLGRSTMAPGLYNAACSAQLRRFTTAPTMAPGLYDAACSAQLESHSLCYPDLDKAIKSITTKKPKRLYTVADFGAAGGSSSIELFSRVASRFSRSGNTTSLQIFLTDLPSSDNNELIKAIDASDVMKNHYPSVIGRSFYERCLPQSSVDLSLSFITLHWLQNDEKDDQNYLMLPSPQVMVHEARVPQFVIDDWANRAHNDLVQFLSHRSVELSVGGAGIYLSTGGGGTHETALPCDWDILPNSISDNSLPTLAISRMIGDGLLSEDKLYLAMVGLYRRAPADIERAVEAVPHLDLLNIEERRLTVGKGSLTGFDLFWAIHAPSLSSSMDLTPSQTSSLRSYCQDVFCEHLLDKNGSMIPYLSFHVQKKEMTGVS